MALAGCGDGGSAGGAGGSGEAPKGQFTIPDPQGIELPTKDVTFRLVDSNDTKAPFWNQLFAAYEKKHPNISCEYDGLPWSKIEEVVPLGIRNKTAHDVIQLPGNVPLDQAVNEGWVAPLDDLIPDIEQWKKKFPELSYAEGTRVFDGKVYSVRLASDKRHFSAIHYNKKYLQEAGYDPASKPLTWDEYRDAAKKITKAGKGQYYGVVYEGGQMGRLGIVIDYLARGAGAAQVGGIDLKTGEYYYDRPEVAEAIELLLALKQDGSVFPGSNSLQAPQAWPRVVRGDAGMVMAGPWVTVLWENENPNFEFGVGESPVRESPLPQAYSVLGGDSVSVYSGSKVKPVAADVLRYVTSVEGQTAWAKICGVGNPPVLEEAAKAAANDYSAQSQQCLKLANQMVTNPEPVIANLDVSLVFQEHEGVSPDYGQVIQSILVGETKNARKALVSLKDRSERALDDAIAKARKKGAKVSREDWVFANWDPTKSYTEADYDAR